MATPAALKKVRHPLNNKLFRSCMGIDWNFTSRYRADTQGRNGSNQHGNAAAWCS
jgi:hypothetical protein